MRLRPKSVLSAAVLAGLVAGVMTIVSVSPALAGAASVGASDFKFSPGTITVHVGDTIVWTSHGPSLHTVTANNGSFDSGAINVNGTFSHTFTGAGTVPYHCTFHQSLGMVGTIVVLASGSGDPGTVPLPNTGAGPQLGLFTGVGVLLLAGGAALVHSTRRRRA